MAGTDYYREWWKERQRVNWRDVPRLAASVPLVPSGGRLLDIGCGDGTFLDAVRPRVDLAVGIEIADIWNSHTPPTHAVIGDAERLPFARGSFTSIVCLDVVEHVFDVPQLLVEIHRILASGGICILSTPNIRQVNRVASILVRGRFPRTSEEESFMDSGHIHFFTGRDFINLAKAAGFATTLRYIVPRQRWRRFKSLLQAILPDRFFGEFFAAGLLVVCRKQKGT